MIIHFNGMPGVGKLTVAREFAHILAARKVPFHLIDNHLIHNIPIALTTPETDEYWALFRQIRDVAFERIRAIPKDHVIIMTNALATGIPTNDEQVVKLLELVAARGDTLRPVLLVCDLPENQKRVQGTDRQLNRKLMSPAKIAEYHARIKLWHRPDGIAFDTTHASADFVAQKVYAALFQNESSGMPV